MVQVTLQGRSIKREQSFYQSWEEGMNFCDIENESDPLCTHLGLTFKAGCWAVSLSVGRKKQPVPANWFSFIWEWISPAVLDTDRWVATESGGRKSFPQVQSASATYLFFNYQLWLNQRVKSKSQHWDTPKSRKHKNPLLTNHTHAKTP